MRHFRRTRSLDNSDQRGGEERRCTNHCLIRHEGSELSSLPDAAAAVQASLPPSLPSLAIRPAAVRRAAPLLRKLLPNDLFRARDLEKRLSRHVPAAPSARSASLLCSALVWRGSRRSLPATDDQQATGRRASEQWIKGNDHSRIALNFVRSQVTSGNRVSRK